MNSLKYLAIASLFFALPALAHESVVRADSHAPAGIMADHTHGEGEWMISYSYMEMAMEGNRDGTSDVTTADILMPMPGTYMVAPTEMSMGMHMLGAMYAPSDSVTVMVMANFIDTDMDHVTAMGGAFSTSTSGLADSSVSALFSFNKTDNSSTVVSAGLLLPTGSIDETGVTPASAPNATQLPYPMQTGSGSFGFQPMLTHTYWGEDWSWGGQVKGTFYLDDNDRDYRLGNRFGLSFWGSHLFGDSLSVSARLAWQNWQNIDGADSALNPMMVPTADPNLRGGERLDAGFGINWIASETHSKTLRFAAEYLTPIHQDLIGPQLETDSTFVLKTQYSF